MFPAEEAEDLCLGQSKRWLIIVCLIIVGTAVAAYAYASISQWGFPGRELENQYGITAQSITEEIVKQNTGYWNLTNPDSYILQAIQNSSPIMFGTGAGLEVYVPKDAPDLTFINQLKEHDRLLNIAYEGKYYAIIFANGTSYYGFQAVDRIKEAFTQGYWELTEPDRYVLEAIQTGKTVMVSRNASDLTFVKQLEQHLWFEFVKYNGNYYFITVDGTPNHKWK
jgi:hypothetical protein